MKTITSRHLWKYICKHSMSKALLSFSSRSINKASCTRSFTVKSILQLSHWMKPSVWRPIRDQIYGMVGLATLARTRAWSTASSRFLESMASVWAAVSICFLHSSFRDVTAFCWARRILLISSARSLFSNFWVPSIWQTEQPNQHFILSNV